jgi:hypothetical protein|tara:strand:- start:51 stop:221 length:171 start_codon:yes stop_codon:yes gene_type:complete
MKKPIYCNTCPKEINFSKFKNELDWKEFKITHMCKTCQNQVFGYDRKKKKKAMIQV